MLAVLRWTLPALVPALLLLVLVYFSDKNKEPLRIVLGTFVLGAVFGVVAFFIERRASSWTGLDDIDGPAGNAGSLVFLFALVAPLREASKVAATWPAFRSRHFDEPYDGVVYSSAAALGFASVESGWLLKLHPTGGMWVVRALLGLPANVFFAAAWGYALGRAKQKHDPGPVFPASWVLATAAHGLYVHLLYGRGETTALATLPLLLAMAAIAAAAARDLRRREGPGTPNEGLERISRISQGRLSAVPSFQAVRAALRKSDQPIRLRWVVFGALVMVGSMLLGFAGAVAFGHWAHVDFSVVNEQDVSTAGPVALLGAGLLAAFPLAGWLVAKASRVSTLLEPALASALAILAALVGLGVTAPVALLVGLSCSPIAWTLACAGAWVGRPQKARR